MIKEHKDDNKETKKSVAAMDDIAEKISK